MNILTGLLFIVVISIFVFTAINATRLARSLRVEHPAICLGDGWQSMETAPRDGTAVELCNTYGIAPSYSLRRWTTERKALDGQTGEVFTYTSETPVWVDQIDSGFYEEEWFLHWRPYSGDPAAYVDPTNGAQKTNAYWLKAMGR